MSEVTNTNVNVFDANKRFVDLAGLDFFWEKAKAYIDGVDTGLTDRLDGHDDKFDTIDGQIETILGELAGITGGTEGTSGIIDTKIEAAISTLSGEVAETYETKADATAKLNTAKKYAEDEADTAEAAAKDYADGLNGAMDTRVKALEEYDYAGLVAGKVSEAVAGVVDNAPDAFNTLKEVADWIQGEGSEAFNAASRITELESDVDTLGQNKADITWVNGQISDAKSHAETKAGEALTAAKGYTDQEVGLAKEYAEGKASDALDAAKGYTNQEVGLANGRIDTIVNTTIPTLAVQSEVETTVAGLNEAIAAAKAAAIKDAKDYTDRLASNVYTKAEVDKKLSDNSAIDQAYAKTYTDELFASIKFATDSEIESIFAVPEEPEA